MVRGHRGKVTAMDCVSDLPTSGNKRKTILIFSFPISTFCTSVLIISRLRCQFASARTGPTFIPCVAVPVSLLGAFGVMYLLGYSLDNLSLMALTISTGFVVDDAIVVIENITRY